MTGSVLRKGMVSTAALLLAVGLAGCGGGSSPVITPTGSDAGVSTGDSAGGATGVAVIAVQADARVDTGAGDGIDRINSVNVGPAPAISIQNVEQNPDGSVKSVTLQYGNESPVTIGNCVVGGVVAECDGSLVLSTRDAGTSTRSSEQYQYLQLAEWYKDYPAPNTTNGQVTVVYGVAGEKTVNMPTQGTAIYKGTADMDIASPGDYATNFITLHANVDMTADFAQKRVSGSMHSFENPDSLEPVPVPGAVNLNGTISGNTFSAGLSGTIDSENVTGSMNGAFFGPDAGEVGGAFTLKSSSSNKVGAGVFAAKKQQP